MEDEGKGAEREGGVRVGGEGAESTGAGRWEDAWSKGPEGEGEMPGTGKGRTKMTLTNRNRNWKVEGKSEWK